LRRKRNKFWKRSRMVPKGKKRNKGALPDLSQDVKGRKKGHKALAEKIVVRRLRESGKGEKDETLEQGRERFKKSKKSL